MDDHMQPLYRICGWLECEESTFSSGFQRSFCFRLSFGAPVSTEIGANSNRLLIEAGFSTNVGHYLHMRPY